VIRARAYGAIERSTAVFVALAIQLVAVAVVGDVFAAPPDDAGLPPPSGTVLRVAPLARGERLMDFDLVAAMAPASDPAPSAPAAEPAAAPAPETAPEETVADPPPEAAPVPLAERAPQPAPEPTPAPRPTSAPTAPSAVTPISAMAQAELRMLALMNASRAQEGLAPFAFDAGVSDTARRHSALEAQVGYVYHDGPDGTAASRNVPACGSGWYGENTGKVWSGGVDALHREFMAEPWAPINHRTNIMDPNFRRAGIGAVQGPDAIYITVVFCR